MFSPADVVIVNVFVAVIVSIGCPPSTVLVHLNWLIELVISVVPSYTLQVKTVLIAPLVNISPLLDSIFTKIFAVLCLAWSLKFKNQI